MEGEFQKQQTGAARRTDPESVIDALILDRQGDKRQDWSLGDSTEGYRKRGAFWTQRLEKNRQQMDTQSLPLTATASAQGSTVGRRIEGVS